jgi:CRISPR/Cas system-associated exonuclease Cas4 (RecB family)
MKKRTILPSKTYIPFAQNEYSFCPKRIYIFSKMNTRCFNTLYLMKGTTFAQK